MQVKDLKVRQGVDSILLELVDIQEPRTWTNARGSGTVANATAKDETGEIKMTLWNDDIDKVKIGDKMLIEEGWVGEWQGEKQLSTGKQGKLTVNP